MVNRLVVALTQPEYSALLQVAHDELRNPPDQLRAILRQELERRGMLPPADQHSEAKAREVHDDDRR